MNRRTLLAGVGGVGLATLAGCLGAAGLDSHESQPAGVEESVCEETGYEQTQIDEIVIEETFEVGPYSETVVVTNHMTEYEKAVGVDPLGDVRAAVFMILTTPQVSVAGQEFNPIEEMSTDELIELVAENYDGIDNINEDGDDEVTVFDHETTLSRFTADAEFEGQPLDVFVHVTEAIETDDDLLVAIGVYPQQVQPEEEPNVIDLTEGIIEEVDKDKTTDGDEDDDENSDDGENGDDDGENGDDDGDSDDGLL